MSDDDKPSPGPWYADGPAVYTSHHEAIAVCGPSGPYTANARFIAAAPEMLELLREVEWAGNQSVSTCPVCNHRPREGGHTPDCQFGTLLARIDGKT